MAERTWGGPRTAGPGKRMGRPPVEHPLRRVDLRLAPADVEQLRRLGDGNVTRGVRRLLAEWGSDPGGLDTEARAGGR